MKKFFMTAAVVVLMFFAQADAAEISSADATCAVETINQRLREWNCTPLKIWYSGIVLDDAKNVAYMNELATGQNLEPKFTACMIFYSDFRSPPDSHDGKITAWNYDSEYKNYSWYFGLYEGKWILMTNGY